LGLAMLSVRNVSAGYGPTDVLQNVTVKIDAGQFTGLIGPNGSGKTTMLRVLSGVLPPSRGEVFFQDTNLHGIGKRQLAKTMAFLSQDLGLDFSFTVRDVTLMGRYPHLSRIGRETREDLRIAEQAMAIADVSHLADRLITATSSGERQRAFIAMCLAQQPKVLLLDEPTSHLDITHQLSILDLIRKLNRRTGITVVAVFHDLNLAAEYCDKLLVLGDGRLQAMGRPSDVITSEMILRVYGAKVLIERNPVSNKPHIVVTAEMNHCET